MNRYGGVRGRCSWVVAKMVCGCGRGSEGRGVVDDVVLLERTVEALTTVQPTMRARESLERQAAEGRGGQGRGQVLDGVLRLLLAMLGRPEAVVGDLEGEVAATRFGAWGRRGRACCSGRRLLVVVREPLMVRFRYPRGGYGKV
jgi:hypothetical protein